MIILIIIPWGCIMIGCIYFMIRNNWVYKISMEMADRVYKYNMKLINDHMYNEINKKSYDDVPDYNFMLYNRFYKWDKDYFMNMIKDNG